MRLILASASPARLAVLRAAGVEPVVQVSGVDEDSLMAGLTDPTPRDVVAALASAKADAVVADLADDMSPCVIIGCDSMLLRDGPDGKQVVGKPGTIETARERWWAMAGGSGELLTGHAVVRVQDGDNGEHGENGIVTARAMGVQATLVRFGNPSERELEAYLATGEPLAVAGGFTLDGLGGWFVEGVDGDPSSVIGISLPLTRALLAEVGVSVVDLWSRT